MSLIAELKRRKVFRVCAGYAVVGWLVIEVADTVFPNLGLPAWTVTLVIGLVALGFPVAAVVAWMFEISPEGLRPTPVPMSGEAVATSSARLLARWWFVAAVALAVVALIATQQWLARRDADARAVPAVGAAEVSEDSAQLRVVAVLPFDNYSPDAADAYFAQGMTEEITSQLSRLAGLRVMSRTAVARAFDDDRPLAAQAAELGVGSVLEGSVRKAGDRVRITTKLVDVRSGTHLWSEDFDRGLADVFGIQREVALAVVAALRSELTPTERARLSSVPTANVEAYQLYLRAGEIGASAPRDNREAIRMLRQALSLDPGFAQAWSKLAWRYQWETWHGDPLGPEKAMEYSARAIELDPQLAEAHVARAAAFIAQERGVEARAAFARARELDPDDAHALSDGGYLVAQQGDLADGLRISAGVLRTEPNVPNMRYHVGLPLLWMGDDRRLASWLDLAAAQGMVHSRLDQLRILLALERDRPADVQSRLREAEDRWGGKPEFQAFAADVRVFLGDWHGARPHLETKFETVPDVIGEWATSRSVRTNLALVLYRIGERERASQMLDEALRYNLRLVEAGSTFAARRSEVAAILAARADPAAVEWLEKSFDAGNRAHRLLARDPVFASLRSDPRFQALLERMAAATARERARVESEHIAAPIDAMLEAGANRASH